MRKTVLASLRSFSLVHFDIFACLAYVCVCVFCVCVGCFGCFGCFGCLCLAGCVRAHVYLRLCFAFRGCQLLSGQIPRHLTFVAGSPQPHGLNAVFNASNNGPSSGGDSKVEEFDPQLDLKIRQQNLELIYSKKFKPAAELLSLPKLPQLPADEVDDLGRQLQLETKPDGTLNWPEDWSGVLILFFKEIEVRGRERRGYCRQ